MAPLPRAFILGSTAMASPLVLTVNAGSSSVRLGLFEPGNDGPHAPRALERRRIDRPSRGEIDAPGALAAFVGDRAAQVRVIAHRVVHGGPRLRAPCPVETEVRAEIARMIPLAPLHNPASLAWIDAGRAALPRATAIAVFDTGFFAALPERAAAYALPRELGERHGLRRLGFHGIAHLSMWRGFLAQRPRGRARVISFQLGGGCSVAALRDGQPVDTSMGFSPLEGLVMATRGGDLDPGLLLHLLRDPDLGIDLAGLDALLNGRSGLLGLSGLSGDVRALVASDRPEAAAALDAYAYRARKYFGAYLAALGGCDAILVGGGAGEQAPALRSRIFEGLEGLGVRLDPARNAAAVAPARIGADDAPIEVWVIPTDEEAVLAAEAAPWLRGEIA
jgi:acetate kinase